MFKNKKVSLVIVTALALTLALGLMAFNSASAVGTDGILQRGGPGNFQPGRGEETYLADALGITAEELQTAYTEAQAAAIEQALAEGLITQPQADRLTERGLRSFAMLVGPESGIDMDALLADALGITVDELADARAAAKDAAIEQALADGKITEEQVALMETRAALKDYVDRDAILAEVLGLTPEELAAAKAEGQRIPELIEVAGMTQDEFETAIQAAHQTVLDQAVADGVITQEQADLINEAGLDGRGLDGHGGHGGRGGHPGSEKPEGFPGGQLPPAESGNGA